MAQKYGEAWLTCAVDDDAAINALVLAESLRRTRTTRRMGVIMSANISTERKKALRKAFDAMFLMDETFLPKGSLMNEERAKVFAFSLKIFNKCIFLSPNSLVLENADKLFEGEKAFKVLKNEKSGSLDLSMFMFCPCLSLCEYLGEHANQNGKTISEKYLRKWLEAECGTNRISYIPGNSVLKMSISKNKLLRERTHAPIIQFVECQKFGEEFVDKMSTITRMELGLSETLIAKKWLEIFNEQVVPSLKNLGSISSMSAAEQYINEPIAIVGMSSRYPGANNLEEFWSLLYRGEEAVNEPPAFRWLKEHSLRVTQHERKTNAGFLSTKVDEFDAKFFGVSPKEAQFMDPQARILHEVLWEALEDSGIDPLTLRGQNTGIFTGSWMTDYRDIVQASTEKDFFRTYLGNSIGAAAARLSFLLGTTGPSIATESGCSSAMVAVNLAIQSLRSGESSMALACGVNLLLHPFDKDVMPMVISPEGRCKTFDAKADGFARGEGCGVLVLKRLSDAIRDKDNIWALIRGCGVSQEGLSRSMGTPTVHCESLAMELALKDANVDPKDVSYVEAHGTGTAVGDPMEISAIAKAYQSPERKEPLIIGSVKTNVGHTESCSGITGIMKTVLAMHHEMIPAHRNFDTLNPNINLESVPAVIPLEAIPWPRSNKKTRLAGVSSFGITGTDAHVIIQEPSKLEPPKFCLGLERPMHIMKISAKSPEALEDMLKSYEEHFQNKENDSEFDQFDHFADAAFTGNTGRGNFNHRLFLLAKDYKQAVSAIQSNKFVRGDLVNSEPGKICFLFTGQGSQYPGMAKVLYQTSPIFRINFDACERTLQETYKISLRPILWDSDSKELNRTIYSQTAIFCIEYCLLRLWESWGLKPDFVLGHSLGEFAAAVAAGILEFKDALKLVAERSRLIDSLPRGSMLVIKANKTEVDKHMKASGITLDFAALNSDEQTVVAGDMEKINNFLEYCKAKGCKAIILNATHAFHSHHMDPMLEEYRKIAGSIAYKRGNDKCKYISGVEGRILESSSEINENYWVRHTREKVSFVAACKSLREAGCQNFLEVGPQPILSSFVMLNNEDIQMNCFPSLRKGADDWDTILTTLGKLYLSGYNINWKGFDETYNRKKVSLPFHPFHRKSYWVEPSESNVALIHPLLGHSVQNASNMNIFQHDLNIRAVPYLKDHCIGSKIVFPGAGYTEMSLTAGYCVANGMMEQLDKPRRPIRLENIKIEAPLELKEEKRCRTQVLVDLPESTGQSEHAGFRVKVFHHQNTTEDIGTNGKWILHATSDFVPVPSTKEAMKRWQPEIIQEVIQKGVQLAPDSFYKAVDDAGLKFGETFRSIKRYWALKADNLKTDKIVAEVVIPDDFNKYLLHPLIIDAAFQAGILTGYRHETSKLKVPIGVDKLTLFPIQENKKDSCESPSENVLWIYAWKENEKYYQFISTPNMEPVAIIEDVQSIDTNVKTIESVLEQQTSMYPDAWEEVFKKIPGPLNNRADLFNSWKQIFGDEYHNALKSTGNDTEEDANLAEQTSRLLYLYILNALYELGWNPKVGDSLEVKSFCKQLGIVDSFFQMVSFYFSTLEIEGGTLVSNSTRNIWTVACAPPSPELVKQEIETLYNFLKHSRVVIVLNIYSRIASFLPQILKGEESALPILFPVDENLQQYSVDAYYQNYPGRPHTHAKMRVIVRSILRKFREANQSSDKVFRILEVGSGTGSMSQDALEWTKEIWGDKFEFYYTDISQSFFVKAEKRLEAYKKQLKFNIFNIEESPLDQGIPLNYFDLVFASDVLHATRNLQESLVHIRQTMRPKAVLCFTETLKEALDLTFVFGLLEGYWRFQDFEFRPYHTCCGAEVWKKVIAQSGFEAAEVTNAFLDVFGCITAQASENINVSSLLTSSEIVRPEIRKKWIIFQAGKSPVFQKVCDMLYSFGYQVEVILRSTDVDPIDMKNEKISSTSIVADSESPSEIEMILNRGKVHGIIYAWGMDVEESNQKRVALPLLHIAKNILSMKTPPRLYVLTQGVHAVTETLIPNPTSATLFGMLKSLKNENSELSLRYIDLEYKDEEKEMVEQILYEIAMSKDSRLQVAYRDGIRYEPKFTKVAMPTPQDQLQLPQSTDRYHLVLPKTRLINDLEFDALDELALNENEIEVKVKAYALNFKDILTILKPSAEFEKLNTVGLDYAGVVTRIGKGVTQDIMRVGDKVFGCNFKEAQLPSHLIVTPESVVPIPANMTYWEAATLPAVFATSYHCLLTIAQMKKDDTVLIHTGSGGVGLSAIQLAKYVGARIITTAGSERKRAYLRSRGIEHVFNSRNTSFEKEILRVTNGRGVDIVLNSITGPGLKEASLNSCAKNARFVEMSKLAIFSKEDVSRLRPDVHYSIVDLTYLEHSAWHNLLENMKRFLNEGSLKSIPFVKFDALNIRQALQYFQKAKHIGKVICAMPEVSKKDGQFKVDIPLFNEQSCYMITGGLGGIGFEIAKWMVEKGARDVVLVGRNPPKPEVAETIKEINGQGHNLIVKYADVGDYEQIGKVTEWIKENGKPLRGIMHCAGVLLDNMYLNQTWKSFDTTYTPKVKGTWNLHHLTKDLPLEHFVFFSSITALMGTPGQPNHASANCFEDAFAHYRHSLGLSATSINWGQWAQVGCAKEITMSGVLPVSVARMLNGLEMTLRNQKVRGCFMDFESFSTWSMLCPLFKSYLDERLWKQFSENSQKGQGFKAEQFWEEMNAVKTREEKMPVISSYLKRILRQALRLEADEPINDDANIQDLGVDSLMLIELKNSIQSLLGSKVNVSASLLKNCNTVRELATAIMGKIVGDDETDQTETLKLSPDELRNLLESDCKLPESILPSSGQSIIFKPSQIRKILLTGCTGQLGPYILSQLCEVYDSLETITCLIRTKEGQDPLEKLRQVLKSMNLLEKVNFDKLNCISGDVTQSQFGLNNADYLALSQSVDAVIHCAVKANHVESYRKLGENDDMNSVRKDIRSVNVGGTLNILKFAAAEKTKQVYYASAYTCIFGENEDETLSDNWPDLNQIEIIVKHELPGYQTSKFVCENLMKEANSRGIPCKVFRFPWITGDSQSGQLNYTHNHYILKFMSYLKLKAMPSLVIPAIVLPVDICAALSLKLFMNDDAPFEIYNVGHPNPQVEQEFVEVAKEDFGINLDIVEFQEFAEKLEKDESPLESFKDLYADVERVMSIYTSDALQSLKGYLHFPETFFKNAKVGRFIPDFEKDIPSCMDIIRNDLRYVKSKGFFKTFGI